MAASITTDFRIPVAPPVATSARSGSNRRRRMTPEAGRAIEVLGHAIEYLTDEAIHRGRDLTAGSPELEAVQLLMAINRQIYYECPEVVTVVARLRSMFHLRAA